MAVGIATAAPVEYSGLHTGVARPDDACILGYAATAPEVRGSGAGLAPDRGRVRLGARERVHDVVVDWRMPNLLSSRFWPARGFRTSFVRLHRLDPMSALRARCPHCRTLTAVAFDDEYECHSCGAAFAAGLVRVPRAWGAGGEAMAEAALDRAPVPRGARRRAGDARRAERRDRGRAAGPAARARRLLLLARRRDPGARSARHGRLAVVWLDAHGDLNTPETSPSGNEWGMPLRMAIDEGSVRPEDVALVGARDLDPPELEYVARARDRRRSRPRARRRGRRVYVALDVDVLEPGEVSCFMPVPGGPSVEEVEAILRTSPRATQVAGLGLTGLAPDADPATLAGFAAAAGL